MNKNEDVKKLRNSAVLGLNYSFELQAWYLAALIDFYSQHCRQGLRLVTFFFGSCFPLADWGDGYIWHMPTFHVVRRITLFCMIAGALMQNFRICQWSQTAHTTAIQLNWLESVWSLHWCQQCVTKSLGNLSLSRIIQISASVSCLLCYYPWRPNPELLHSHGKCRWLMPHCSTLSELNLNFLLEEVQSPFNALTLAIW